MSLYIDLERESHGRRWMEMRYKLWSFKRAQDNRVWSVSNARRLCLDHCPYNVVLYDPTISDIQGHVSMPCRKQTVGFMSVSIYLDQFADKKYVNLEKIDHDLDLDLDLRSNRPFGAGGSHNP